MCSSDLVTGVMSPTRLTLVTGVPVVGDTASSVSDRVEVIESDFDPIDYVGEFLDVVTDKVTTVVSEISDVPTPPPMDNITVTEVTESAGNVTSATDTADYSKLVMVKVKVEETTKDPNHFDAAIYVRNVTEMADSEEMEEEEMFYYDDYLAELASGDNVTTNLSDYELAKPVVDIDMRVGNTTKIGRAHV